MTSNDSFLVVDEEVSRQIDEYLDWYYEGILATEGDEHFERNRIEFLFHRDRVRLCIDYIYELLQVEKPENILVLGDETIIDYCLKEIGAYDGIKVTFTEFELRENFPFSEETFDLVICLEVFEHLKDKNDSQRDLFMFTGVNNLISESRRVLKTGKKMLLSTPNACSLKALCRVFQHKHPYAYARHVREYAPQELIYILEVHQFDVEHLETHDVWNNFDGKLSEFSDGQNVNWAENKTLMENVLKSTPFPEEYRGDDIFVIARRVS